MKLEQNHRYLMKKCTHSSYGHDICEWVVLEVTELSYKIREQLNQRIFWIEQDQIRDKMFNSYGYFVFENLGKIGTFEKTDILGIPISELLKKIQVQDSIEKEEEVFGDKLPTTLNEAIHYILPKFKNMETEIMEMSQEEFCNNCHSMLMSGGIGMKIRNELGLWNDNSKLTQHFKDLKIDHSDDMSDLILKGVWKEITKSSLEKL